MNKHVLNSKQYVQMYTLTFIKIIIFSVQLHILFSLVKFNVYSTTDQCTCTNDKVNKHVLNGKWWVVRQGKIGADQLV